ncbi:hypothetical protein F5Y12DRAFT_170213 [Xylaria sp. FL1777]|nr:hypothetical protein F5Y12DRAFT_170213 [Xylaria sp. FL1777]
MELRPIKVRGKRRTRDQLLVAPPPKRLHKNLSQKKQAKVRRPKASNIERSMPLEVLEHVFWLSENVNFPRASPRLGRLLSGPSTLRETFVMAFGPTWEVWFGCIHGPGTVFPTVHSYAGWEEDADRFGGNPSFQTDLLACSWTTIDMILDCRDIWVRRHARNLPFKYFPIWGNPINPISYTGSGITTGLSDIKEARCYFYHDYHAFRNVEQQSFYGKISRPERSRRLWSTRIEVHRSTEIPDDIITGPWDESSFQKLFWLVQAGARLSSAQTWEITHEGFRNAISDQYAPNLTAIRLLHILGAFQNWPDYIKANEIDKISTSVRTSKGDRGRALLMKYTYITSLLLS